MLRQRVRCALCRMKTTIVLFEFGYVIYYLPRGRLVATSRHREGNRRGESYGLGDSAHGNMGRASDVMVTL